MNLNCILAFWLHKPMKFIQELMNFILTLDIDSQYMSWLRKYCFMFGITVGLVCINAIVKVNPN